MISSLVASAAVELESSVECLRAVEPDRARGYTHARRAAAYLIRAYRLLLPRLSRNRPSRRLDLISARLWLSWRELVDLLCDWPGISAQRLEALSRGVREMVHEKSDRIAA